MIRIEPQQYRAVLPFVPDEPEATLPVCCIAKGRGDVFVDDLAAPRSFAVHLEGVSAGEPAKAFLYGLPGSEDLKQFLEELEDPTEVFCSPDLSELVQEAFPDAQPRKYMVYHFDRVTDLEVSYDVEVRRLRASDTGRVSQFLPSWAWGAFESVREMILGGAVYAAFDGGAIVSAAFITDSTVKYDTLAVMTAESHRRRGYGYACSRRLIKSILDRSKLPRMMAPARHEAAVAFAWKLGFPKNTEVVSWFLDIF